MEVLLGENGRGLLVAALIILLANGLINTTLLYKYQKSFNTRVTEIAQRCRTRFSKNGSPTVPANQQPDVEANDLPPKYDDEYESPPNYEEAAKVAGLYNNVYHNAAAPVRGSAPEYEAPVYEEIDQYGRAPQGQRVNEGKDVSTV